jgi:Stress responsive A/B Barrel Domain
MVKHIVVWNLKEFAEGNDKNYNAQKVKELLESMNGKIPGLRHIEVGINFTIEDGSADVVLYSELDSREALDVYQNHPVHIVVKDFIKNVRSERHVIDYVVE